MRPLPGAPQGITFEMLKNVKIGTLEIPELPGVNGVALAPLEEKLGVDLDGVVGSGLLSAFRVTLVDGGRTMWLEDHQTIEETLASPETEPIPQEPGPFTLPPPG
jgi:hypothetical protein